MRVQWIVVVLCTLVSMGLLVVIVGQQRVLDMMSKSSEKLLKPETSDDELLKLDLLLKASEEELLAQGVKAVDLVAEVAKLDSEMEKKKTEIDACQSTKADVMKNEHTDAEAYFKSESDAWKEEINNLNAQLKGYSPICDYVQSGSLAAKICGTKQIS